MTRFPGMPLAIGDTSLEERQTMLVRLPHWPRRDGDALPDALVVRKRAGPGWPATSIRRSLGSPVYFCDSNSPWQRGTNENANGLLRDFV
jgi:hypothetical protein